MVVPFAITTPTPFHTLNLNECFIEKFSFCGWWSVFHFLYNFYSTQICEVYWLYYSLKTKMFFFFIKSLFLWREIQAFDIYFFYFDCKSVKKVFGHLSWSDISYPLFKYFNIWLLRVPDRCIECIAGPRWLLAPCYLKPLGNGLLCLIP